MAFEDYLALPPRPKAEYVDGVALVSPPPQIGHQRVERRLMRLLEDTVADAEVVAGVGVRTRLASYRVPDVVVLRHHEGDEVVFTEQTPLLVVEILSPSTRGEDTVRKSGEYASAGFGHYWLVDRDNRAFTALATNGHGWDVVLELDDARPAGAVSLGTHGVVEIDLETLLA